MFVPTPGAVIVREISASFADCLHAPGVEIDVERARAQHRAYVAAIGDAGGPVTVLPPDDDHPDACFVEDPAVVIGRRALITVPGAASRRGEVEAVATALAEHCELHRMALPATLDGGDVLQVGGRMFVGLSERTNEAGVKMLETVAAEEGVAVIAIHLQSGLHLKEHVTLAGANTLLVPPEFDTSPFDGFECVEVEGRFASNVLALGSAVLVSRSAPQTAAALERRGFAVRAVLADEIHKGDGALTCLSLRIPMPGSWAT